MRSIIFYSWILMWFNSCCFAVSKVTITDAQKKQDSLWSVWKNPTKSDTDRLKAIDKFIWDGYLFTEPDSAFYFAIMQSDFAVKQQQLKYQSNALNIKGLSHMVRTNYDSALAYYNQALKLNKQIDDKYAVTSILNNISNVELSKGNYTKVLEYVYQSLKINEGLHNNYGMAANYNNIGNIYDELGDLKTAFSFYKRALKLAELTKDKRIIKDIQNNIGNSYSELGNYTNSIQYYKKALSISYELNDVQGISGTLLNLGGDYLELKKYDSAVYFLNQSLPLMQELDDMDGVASVYSNLAAVYKAQLDYDKATDYAKHALVLAQEQESNLVIRDVSHILYQIYKETNNNKDALEMLELYNVTNDSIINDYNQKALLRSQLQYDFDKKAESIRKENALKDLKLSRRAYTIAVLLIIALLSYVIYFLKIRNNKLQASKNAIELEHKLLGSQMNTHFTFNAINSIQEYILNNQNEEAHYYLSEFAKLMRMVLSHNRKKTIAISDEVELLEKYILLEEQRIKDKINFKIINSNQVDLDNVKIPSMIIQPLIENSIWHGLKNKEGAKNIELIFTRFKDTFLKIEVVDNGIGQSKQVDKTIHISHSSAIVKERIKLLYTKEPEFDYFELKNNIIQTGVTAILIIPLINEFE